MGSLGGDAPQLIRESVSRALYVEPGFLLYVRQGTLFAEAFDWQRRSFSGAATPVARNVAFGQRLQTAFTASNAGVVVYRSPQPVSQLAWVTRTGVSGGLIGEPGDYLSPRLSPDEQSVAAEVHSLDASGQSEGNIWVATTAQGIFTKLTFDVGTHSTNPLWSPDGIVGHLPRRRRRSAEPQIDCGSVGRCGHPHNWSAGQGL